MNCEDDEDDAAPYRPKGLMFFAPTASTQSDFVSSILFISADD